MSKKPKYKPQNLSFLATRDKKVDRKLDDIIALSTSDICFDDIKVIKKLGTGSQGCVKKVQVNDKYYAMKVTPIEEDDQARKNLITEYKTLLSCDYPNVVQLYQVFLRENNVFMVLEYMNVGSLDKVLTTTKKIPESVIAKIAAQILKGLVHIHQKKFIHRDIKPANILLDTKGIVKLADFGMAGLNKSIYHTFQGSQFYMSPERLRGEEHTFNSDIWGLGLTLSECVLGRYPIDMKDKTIWEIMLNFDKSEISFESENSKEFVDFITKCTDLDKNTRPGAMELLEHDFIKKNQDGISIGRWIHENIVKVKQAEKSSVPK